jgi:hypothetical protein
MVHSSIMPNTHGAAGRTKLALYSTILVCTTFESALVVGRRYVAVYVLAEAHGEHVPHRSHHPRHHPVRFQALGLCLLLALLHDPLVAVLLDMIHDRVNHVDPQVLLVVLSEGSVVACLMPVNVHVDIEAMGLIHPIGS